MIFSTCIFNFTDQKTISSSFYHPSRVMSFDSLNMICPARLDTRLKLKRNYLCTPARAVINNHSKSSPIIRNDLRLHEMNSRHSKTAMTLLALRPLHEIWDLTLSCVRFLSNKLKFFVFCNTKITSCSSSWW